MAQQQHILCSASSGRLKTGKPKKVRQRGLGVAQLEKIRIEEQLKKEAIEAANVMASSSANETVTAPCVDVHFPLQVGKHFLNGGNWPGNLEGDKDLGFAYWSQVHPTVLVPQRSHQFQCPPSIAAKESLGIPPSPPLVSSSQIEPPSNQSHCSNSYATPPPPEERKMVGMKRPYPFPLDRPPSLRTYFHHHGKFSADELPSCSPNHNEARTEKKCMRDSSNFIGKLNGDFLTLAPPDSKHPLDHSELCLPCSQVLNSQPINLFSVKLEMEETMNGDGEKGEDMDLNLKL